jgi:hypothetical protein
MSGKFKVPIQLVDETNENGTVTVFAADDHLLLKTTGGDDHVILDDRTALGSMASQDADSVAITGGSIAGITPLAISDGGTGASTADGALANLGAVPTSRTVNGKSLNTNITLGASDVEALPNTTTYGASLAADGEDISLIDQNGTTLATVQTQDITGKLDKQAVYSSVGDVADLTTTAKDTTVHAINELVTTFSSYVPTTRTVNGKALSSNITLSNSDIGSEPAITAGTTSQFWQGNKSWQDFGDSVRATLLTGLSTTTSTAIAATDTTISAFGKLQAQISSSMPNPMVGPGDIIVGGTNGVPERLAPGTDGQFLTLENGSPAWRDTAAGGLPIEKFGDLVAGADFGQLKRVPIGNMDDVLTVVGGTRKYPDIEYSTAVPDILKKMQIAYGNGIYLVDAMFFMGYSTDITAEFSLVPTPMNNSQGGSNKLKFLNGYFFYYGLAGALWYTSDPTSLSNWTKADIGTTSTIVDMAYFNGYYFAVAGSSSYQSSSPGGAWSSKSTGLSAGGKLSQNGNSRLAIKFSSKISYLTSADSAWTVVDLGISNASGAMAYGNGYWCFSYTPNSTTVGVGYSTDLTSWSYNTNIYTTTAASPYDMYFFGGTFETYNRRSTSPTATWTNSSYAASSYGDKFWVNGYYCYSMIYQADRGHNMPYRLGLDGSSSNINCQYKEGSIDIAMAYNNTRYAVYPHIIYGMGIPLYEPIVGNSQVQFGGICTNGTNFGNYAVLVGQGGYVYAWKMGATSSPSSIKNSGTTAFLRGIAHGNGTWVAVGDNGTIRYTSDISSSATWSTGGQGITKNLKHVRWCGDRFIAIPEVGEGYPMVYHSKDGATWYGIEINMLGGQVYNIIDAVFFKGSVYLLINGMSRDLVGTQLGKNTTFHGSN